MKAGQTIWTDEQLIECFPKARSMHHLALMLGLKRINRAVQKRAKTLGLPIEELDKKHERHNYTVDELREAVASSYSYAQVLEKLNIVIGGGNYKTIKDRCVKHNIDISHFTGQGWNAGKILKKTTSQYFTKVGVKVKLLSERGRKCENCHSTEWMEKEIPIEVHHIDGDRTNNIEENLQLLCPNCHALTDNYRGRNIKKVPNGSFEI